MRKIGAEKIFDGYRMLENHVLLISEEGVVVSVVPKEEAGEDVEQVKGVLTPGFVNSHCHLELSHMKGRIPERTRLVDFVFKVVTERSASEEEIREAIAHAEKEMKDSGIVAVGDICNNTMTLAQKQQGNLYYYNFIEASGWLPAVSEARFERAKGIYEAYVNGEWSMVNAEKSQATSCKLPGGNSIVPHAAYSVSEGLWERIGPYFEGKVVSIHNQETRFEDEFFLKGTGDFKRMYELMEIDNSHHVPTRKSSLQSYFNKLSGAERVILVHNTFTKEEDVMYVRRETSDVRGEDGEWSMVNAEKLRAVSCEQREGKEILAQEEEQPSTTNHQPPTYFCLCVNANRYIEDAMPPVEMLRRNGCAIVLGTDSLASNWSLSILDEMKTIRQHYPFIPLEEMLGWATLNGARALNMDDWLGSFEKGKKPGVVLMEEDNLIVKKVLFGA